MSHRGAPPGAGRTIGTEDHVRLLVLGPVEVRSGDRDLLAGCRPAQRALLGLLAMRPNQVISRAQLVDRVWGDHQPTTADQLLQGYVSRLRAALRRGGQDCADRLATTGGGYLLRVGAGELDLLEFRELARSGGQALAEGDPAGAAGLLRRALALWRGPALGGLSLSPIGQAEVTALEEGRMAALEQRMEADLRLGRHAAVIGELRALVAEHPLREQLWTHLMAALWRGGRKAEALAAYAEARNHLITELGLEPGPALRRVQQAIITAHEPVRSVPAAVPPTAVPAELPPAPPTFAGRHRELDRLRELLTRPAGGPAPVVAISGVAGVGKSAIAAHLAHEVAARFAGGQLYADLGGSAAGVVPRPPHEVLGQFLRGLGVPAAEVPADAAETAGRFRSFAAQRDLLVVLDNAISSAQVRPLLPAGHGCATLVTSRATLTGLDGAVHVHLGTLSPADAVDLLSRLVGPARIADEPGAAYAVARYCDGLPLALRIAGARLAARPTWAVRELADRLADPGRRLDELQTADLRVRAAIEVSYRAAGAVDGLQRAFRLLSLLPRGDFGVPAAAAALGLPAEGAAVALEQLVDARLLEPAAVRHYRFHELVRLFGRERAVEGEAATAAVGSAHGYGWPRGVRPAGHHSYLRTARPRRRGGPASVAAP